MDILSVNPADNTLIKKYKAHTAKQVQQKITQTHKAWQSWRASTFKQRSALLHQLAAVLAERKTELARLMALEMGKPLKQGVAEIEKCAAVCIYYADNAEGFLKDQMIETEAPKSYATFQPL